VKRYEMSDRDSLEQQWRDHVNDGLVVKWFKALVRRIRAWRRPPVQVVLQIRRMDRPEIALQYFSIGVQPGQVVQVPLFPIIVGRGDRIEVVVDAIDIRSPAWGGL
jgi:hypothetical protein